MSPREFFDRFQQHILAGELGLADDMYADDVVIEWPFARPGMPSRIEGREQFLAFAAPARAALPLRFDALTDVVVHETGDPEVIVAEFRLTGTHTATGRTGSAAFIQVWRVRDGKLVGLREYQDASAINDVLTAPAA
ncbi:MAG: nuclear transport factor 2 family protein [Micromonosporaceae bacterium]|nr:nuclear transport factor 2 family protein [Micromonosporaceae bacterium]